MYDTYDRLTFFQRVLILLQNGFSLARRRDINLANVRITVRSLRQHISIR